MHVFTLYSTPLILLAIGILAICMSYSQVAVRTFGYVVSILVIVLFLFGVR